MVAFVVPLKSVSLHFNKGSMENQVLIKALPCCVDYHILMEKNLMGLYSFSRDFGVSKAVWGKN